MSDLKGGGSQAPRVGPNRAASNGAYHTLEAPRVV
jgi:hypothetical protein